VEIFVVGIMAKVS